MQTFADRACWLREKAGLSQRRLAVLLGSKSVSHVSLIEGRSDGARVTAETAAAYCRVFGVDFEWLVNGNGAKPDEKDVQASAGRAEPPDNKDDTVPTAASFEVVEDEAVEPTNAA